MIIFTPFMVRGSKQNFSLEVLMFHYKDGLEPWVLFGIHVGKWRTADLKSMFVVRLGILGKYWTLYKKEVLKWQR